MYHFVLHPRSEEGETNAFDIASRGTLLTWIDLFFSKPLTLRDRTVGRYDNLLPSLHNVPKEILGRITLRVFSAGKKVENSNPLTHSDVAKRFFFWKEECWKPETSLDNCYIPVE